MTTAIPVRDTQGPDHRGGDGAVLVEGLRLDLDRRHSRPGRGQQRQPLSFLPGQAGPAGRGARGISRRHRPDAARSGLGRGRRSDRADLRPARQISRADRHDRLPLRLPDRQPRARAARARSDRAPAHGREFRRLDRRDPRLPRAGGRPLPGGQRFPVARRIHPDGDGGRGDAGAHLSRRRLFRPGDRPDPPVLRQPDAREEGS